MLRFYRTETIPLGDGRFEVRTLDEIEDDPCTICGEESVPNICAMDGRLHHHGMVHNPIKGQNRLEARCKFHAGTPNHSPFL